jgi:hypothetical protein
MESLPATTPGSQVLVSRRVAAIGVVEYALVVYREAPGADSLHFMAVAVHRDRVEKAWDLDATCPATLLPEGLVSTMEALGNLK